MISYDVPFPFSHGANHDYIIPIFHRIFRDFWTSYGGHGSLMEPGPGTPEILWGNLAG